MTSSAMKNNFLPPGLVSNLQEVLNKKAASSAGGGGGDKSSNDEQPSSSSAAAAAADAAGEDDSRPVVLVTNSDGIDSPGLTFLVEALVRDGAYNVNVCAPQSDKTGTGHSVSLRETVAVTLTDINGATAYEVSGTPVDCVSLALSGALFSWTKPLLVISGVNKGSSCGHQVLYSSGVAGAREALVSGVPALSISLNWKKDESQDSHFKEAVSICLPLITSAIRDIEKGAFPKSSLLNIEVPTSPSSNKGFKLTRQSLFRPKPCWQAISANRQQRFMSNQQSLGMQLAQLGRDASAAGAARRLTTQKQNLEVVESIGVAGKSDPDRKVKYFRIELLDATLEDEDEDLDFRALENGFVAITPLSISTAVEADTHAVASAWISATLQADH